MIRALPRSFVSSLRLSLARWALKAAGGNWQRVIREVAEVNARFFPDLGTYQQQAQTYLWSSWVAVAINRVATDSAVVPLGIKQIRGEKTADVPNHELEQLLRHPNGWQSRFEFLFGTYAFRELTGNAYWFLNGSPGGPPTQLMLLRPDRVQIVPGPDSETRVKGYVYIVEGVEVPLEPEEVIHFPLFHPGDDYYGLSRLQAAALAVTTDKAMQTSNRNVFADGRAVPAGIVNIKNLIDDTNYDRIVREWQQNYGGTQQKTAFIRGADVEWQNVGLSQKDLDFIQGRQFTKEEILLIFGVWPGMLDKNATEANALAALDTYDSRTVWPSALSLAEKITQALCPYYGADLFCEPEDIRKKDRAGDRDDLKIHAPYMTVNEVRTRFLDLDPYEGDPLVDEPADVPSLLLKPAAPAGFGAPPSDGVMRNILGNQAQTPSAPTMRELQPAERNLLPDNVGKTIDAYPDVPRVYLNRSMRREIEQFGRYAAKGKDPTTFTFQEVPLGMAIALRAVADVSQFDLLSVKVLLPAPDEPRSRVKLMGQLHSALSDYFTGLAGRLVKGVRHVNAPSTGKADGVWSDATGVIRMTPSGKALPDLARFRSYFDRQFWSNELAVLSGAVIGLIHDLVDAGFTDTADALQMATGLSMDTASSAAYAADYAATYTDAVLRSFQTTTQDGVGAILSRYISTDGATISDLVTALQESPLFSPDRARLVAMTEATRAYGAGNYLAGEAMAGAASVEVAVSQSDVGDLLPAHPNCRCGITAEYTYDDQNRIDGLDYRWYALNDERTCPICGPRDGKLVSEIANGV